MLNVIICEKVVFLSRLFEKNNFNLSSLLSFISLNLNSAFYKIGHFVHGFGYYIAKL